MTKTALIIPAAGSGSRLNRDIPKPYIRLAGKPILEHTVRRFLSLESLAEVVVATSREYLEEAGGILKGIASSSLSFTVVEGGRERQHSIYNALQEIDESEIVIVHDAVRPFVNASQIEACCRTAEEVGGAVLGVPAKDTIKKVDDGLIIKDTPSRRYLWQAQTPQVFRKEILVEAYRQAMEVGFVGTDDASLVERIGRKVKMVEGDRSNFKITYPLDLKLAGQLLEEETKDE